MRNERGHENDNTPPQKHEVYKKRLHLRIETGATFQMNHRMDGARVNKSLYSHVMSLSIRHQPSQAFLSAFHLIALYCLLRIRE